MGGLETQTGLEINGRDIGWVDSIALKLMVLWLICDGYADCNITVHGDNTGVIGAFYKGRT